MRCPESAPGATPPAIVPVGDEEGRAVVSAARLKAAVEGVDTELVVLAGTAVPPPEEVAAMIRLRAAGGWVARAVPVTDALKIVEEGRVTGDVDRSTAVALRLPILVETAAARRIAEAAEAADVDLAEALAASGPGAAYTRGEALP